jgi:hypothetical protein
LRGTNNKHNASAIRHNQSIISSVTHRMDTESSNYEMSSKLALLQETVDILKKCMNEKTKTITTTNDTSMASNKQLTEHEEKMKHQIYNEMHGLKQEMTEKIATEVMGSSDKMTDLYVELSWMFDYFLAESKQQQREKFEHMTGRWDQNLKKNTMNLLVITNQKKGKHQNCLDAPRQ